MSATSPKEHWKACLWLVLACVFWGLSFPSAKALFAIQKILVPHANTWFLVAATLTGRFALAALILLAWQWKKIGTISRLELEQGLGAGVFTAAGNLFQMDGLNFTEASTGAFLTQATCVFIPIITAIYSRSLPSKRTAFSLFLACVALVILTRFNWKTLRIGRGELETLTCAVFFTAQMFWVNRPSYRGNRSLLVAIAMFVATAFLLGLAGIWNQVEWVDWFQAFSTPSAFSIFFMMTITGILGGYTLMITWQPKVTPTEAGIIYCTEPVFASFQALFLPGLFSAWAGISYANETLTPHLLWGGGLITLANILLHWKDRKKNPPLHS